MTGKATRRLTGYLPIRSFTRCTSKDSQRIRTPASQRGIAEPFVDSSRRFLIFRSLGFQLLNFFLYSSSIARIARRAGLITGAMHRSPFSRHTRRTAPGRIPSALDEFRDMVKALHRAGIEVILDVVFNHTAE